MIHLFDGEEEFGKAEAVQELRAALGDPTVASLNTTVLEGARATPAAIEEAAFSMPFLAERRLVIVEGALAAFGTRKSGSRKRAASGDAAGQSDGAAERLAALLPDVPASTDLVFVESSPVAASHPVLKAIKEIGGQRKTFPALNPRRRDDRETLVSWIKARAAKKGSRIDATAVAALMNRVGANLRQLDQELEKLAVYSGSAVITEPVVHLLVADTRETDVWEIVRAIGAQNAQSALHTLHSLLEAGERPEAIFFQIVRQLRLLLQVADLASTPGTSDNAIGGRLGLQDWQVRQHREQLAAIGAAKARRIYRQLLATDVAMKTGRTTPELALDLLVGELCGAH